MKEVYFSLIPRPVFSEYSEEIFQSHGLPDIKGDDFFKKEIDLVTGQLHSEVEHMGRSLKAIVCQKETVQGAETNEEAYRISVAKSNITIGAATTVGMYNGLQSVRQLVLSDYHEGLFALPCGELIDYPRYTWRGFMLDCSRHFYSVAFIKKIIDINSLHHINRFHWHLTDDQGWRLPVPEYPLLTEVGSLRHDRRQDKRPHTGGFYTEDEIREVVEFAASRHVEVIPEVDLPGHASAILASYPALGCTGGPYNVEDRFGIFEDVLCAGNDQIFDLAEKVFDTLTRLFPSRYIHIGGDEVPSTRWEACPKCQNRLAELGLNKPNELQSWITMRLVDMLSQRGKTAIGWDEVLEDTEKFKIPKETIIMSWRGTESGTKAAGAGHNVIMSPCTNGCYLDYKHIDDPDEPGRDLGISSVYDTYSMEPGSSERILGGQCNLWSEIIYAGRFAEYMIFPRLCAASEVFWTNDKDFDNFSRRLAIHQKRLDRLGVLNYKGALK